MKKLLALLLALLMVLSLAACGGSGSDAADAGDEGGDAPAAGDDGGTSVSGTSLSIGTGGSSGTYYAFSGVLSTFLEDKTGVKMVVNESGGSAANIAGIDSGLYDLGLIQSDVMYYAYNGENTYEESGAVTSFVTLGALYPEAVQIVTCDPNIKSVADLKGKDVCVGDTGSGTNFNTIDILAAYDMTIDDINPVYQSFQDSVDSLKDNKIAAAVISAGPPTGAITDLAATKDMYLISIDDEHMAKLLDANPWYNSYTVPAGTYSGFDEDATTICVKATLIARSDIDDDLAYAIVSTILDPANKDAIAELHSMGNLLDLKFATEGLAAPFAAGAAKFYAEQGIEVDVAQ